MVPESQSNDALGKEKELEKEKARLEKEKKRNLQVLFGLIGFIVLLLLPSPKGLPVAGKNIMVLLFFQIYLLVTRALPFGVVGLLPLICLPLFGIVGPKVDAKTLLSSNLGYADDIIFLVLAGFMVGGAMERWSFHKRISYGIASVIGKSPSTMLLGFMVASAFISMFLTNTATVVMMMPIAVAFLKSTNISPGNKFGVAMVTGVSYAGNIGGVGTPTGSSYSAAAVGLIPTLTGKAFTYADYICVGIPYVIVAIVLAWFILTRLYRPNSAAGTEKVSKTVLTEARKNLGPWTKAEVHVAIFLIAMIVGLITRPLVWGKYIPLMQDGMFLTLLAVLMFLIPEKNGMMLYDWKAASKDIDWGMLLMIGGSFVLSAQLGPTGVTKFLADGMTALKGIGSFVGIYAVAAITNVLCNFGVTLQSALPLSQAVAEGLGLNMALTLFVVTCVAQLNIALPNRPTNAMSSATGYATVSDHIKGGILISISNVIIGPIVVYLIAMGLFRIGVTW